MARIYRTAAGLFLAFLISMPLHAESPQKCPITPGNQILSENSDLVMKIGDDLIEIPNATKLCLSCHDGTIAQAVEAGNSGLSLEGRSGRSASTSLSTNINNNHRVGMEYPVSRPGYVPRAQLDERLKLEDGLVTCLTCHTGNENTRSRLSISNTVSRLCLSCHIK